MYGSVRGRCGYCCGQRKTEAAEASDPCRKIPLNGIFNKDYKEAVKAKICFGFHSFFLIFFGYFVKENFVGGNLAVERHITVRIFIENGLGGNTGAGKIFPFL